MGMTGIDSVTSSLVGLDSGWQRFPHPLLHTIDANKGILAKVREIAGKVRLPELTPTFA